MDRNVIVWCKICDIPFKLPAERGNLQVTCPSCNAKFMWTPPSRESLSSDQTGFPNNIQERKVSPRPKWPVIGLAIVGLSALVIYVGFAGNQNSGTGKSGLFSPGHKRQEVKVEYGNLVDKSILTHSGETVGSMLNELSKQGMNEVYASNLQPYLEPFSFICNEIVTSIKQDSDDMPYLNIIAEYSPGSKQPAWAALLRGGQYQVFSNRNRIRMFLPGYGPTTLLDEYHDVLRHPVAKIMNEMSVENIEVEVYAFQNDYRSQTIKLDVNPFITELSSDWVAARNPALPIESLEKFFKQKVTLEAAEVDTHGNLYLYGIPRKDYETVARSNQSLSDFAVVYRSINHSGKNPPYISLDNHEDNRYAKVNFGGYLEDTGVGSVVLEADKLFKAISTGLDPNTRKPIHWKIREEVPGFLTEDERSLSQDRNQGRMQIRYWFYPDKIRTETDGNIGVVENPRFLADAERMDTEVSLGTAQRDTIDHLNQNFDHYSRALLAFKELDTVGRMMAIVNWLNESGFSSKFDLASLLSVELPEYSTPRRTQKMLAITATATIQQGGRNVEGNTKVYSLDKLLTNLSSKIDDEVYLDAAGEWFDQQDGNDLLPASTRKLVKRLDQSESEVDRLDRELTVLQDRLEIAERKLNEYNEYEVRQYNNMVDEFNALRERHRLAVTSYNRELQELKSLNEKYRTIVSIGGGINMRPKDFAKPSYKPESPRIQRIRDFKNGKGLTGKGGKPALVRSGLGTDGTSSLYKKPAPKPWTPRTPVEGSDSGRAMWERSDGTTATIENINDGAHRKLSVRNPKYFNDTTISISKGGSAVVSVVETSQYPSQIIIIGSSKPGGTIVLKPGEKVHSSPITPIWD